MLNPHAPYITAVAHALARADMAPPALATLHTDNRPLRPVHTAELTWWGTASTAWPGIVRLCWNSRHGWAAAPESPAPGIPLGAPVLADPADVATNLRHLLTYGPASRPPGGYRVWEEAASLEPDPFPDRPW